MSDNEGGDTILTFDDTNDTIVFIGIGEFSNLTDGPAGTNLDEVVTFDFT